MTLSSDHPFRPERWPAQLPSACWLLRAQVPPSLRAWQGDGACALQLSEGLVAQVLPQAVFDARPARAEPVFDLDGATVLSAFVDPHTHLDKGDLCAAGLAPE
ncbi:MAG: hypothetical protein ACKOD9_04940, partial [Rubrivivax sp.]